MSLDVKENTKNCIVIKNRCNDFDQDSYVDDNISTGIVYRPPTKLRKGNVLQACVFHWVVGLGYHWLQVPSWSVVPYPFRVIGYLWSPVPSMGRVSLSHIPSRGRVYLVICSFGGGVGYQGVYPDTLPPRTTKAFGTHPTGVLSCVIWLRTNVFYTKFQNILCVRCIQPFFTRIKSLPISFSFTGWNVIL